MQIRLYKLIKQVYTIRTFGYTYFLFPFHMLLKSIKNILIITMQEKCKTLSLKFEINSIYLWLNVEISTFRPLLKYLLFLFLLFLSCGIEDCS